MPPVELAIFLVFVIVFLFGFLYLVPINMWITAIFSGVKIEIFELIFMRIRRAPVKDIIRSLIMLYKAGIPVTNAEIETQGLAGVNLNNVTIGLINAKNADVDLSLKDAAAMDLAGVNIDSFIMKKKLEVDGGIPEIRAQLSQIILNELDAAEIKELSRTVASLRRG